MDFCHGTGNVCRQVNNKNNYMNVLFYSYLCLLCIEFRVQVKYMQQLSVLTWLCFFVSTVHVVLPVSISMKPA